MSLASCFLLPRVTASEATSVCHSLSHAQCFRLSLSLSASASSLVIDSTSVHKNIGNTCSSVFVDHNYTRIYLSTYTCTCSCMHAYMSVCVVCMFVCIYCMYACMYECLYGTMGAYMYVCMYDHEETEERCFR